MHQHMHAYFVNDCVGKNGWLMLHVFVFNIDEQKFTAFLSHPSISLAAK